MILSCLFGRHDPVPVRRIALAGTGGWEAWRVRCRDCKREQDYKTTGMGRRVDVGPWVRA